MLASSLAIAIALSRRPRARRHLELPARVTVLLNNSGNSVSQSGNVLTVQGTAGNDVFLFQAGSPLQVSLNGMPIAIDPHSGVDTIHFLSNGGQDTAIFVGGPGATAL